MKDRDKTIFGNEELDKFVQEHGTHDLLSESIFNKCIWKFICSWCNRLKTGSDRWQEIEIGMERMPLFEKDLYPTLSHGICPDCYRTVSRTVDEY